MESAYLCTQNPTILGTVRVHRLSVHTLTHTPPLAPVISDRLGELERDKARLSEQLIAQQREHLVREMDILKKSKSKNLLKRGFKKLKGKIHVSSMFVHHHFVLLVKEVPTVYTVSRGTALQLLVALLS